MSGEMMTLKMTIRICTLKNAGLNQTITLNFVRAQVP